MDDARGILARLAEDRPLFHEIDEDGAGYLASVGISFQAGDCSWAVGFPVLGWIAAHVTDEMETIETGAGYTTVVLAAAAKHHHCCTRVAREEERIRAYLERIGVPQGKVSFSIGSTDRTLPGLDREAPLDFAYIDGCHGYPFPALDWHYVDRHLKVGGVIGMDNAEIRPVREHCAFLEENGAYEPYGELTDEGYLVRFYRKLRDENREWVCQAYSKAGNAWLQPFLAPKP